MRIFTIIVIGITTLSILLGGTYYYQKYIYTNPLEDAVRKINVVNSFQIERDRNRLLISVQFNDKDKLRPNFYRLLDQLEGQKAGSLNNLTIRINNSSNDKMANFLKDAKLPVYEAISTGHFTALPGQLNDLSNKEHVKYNLDIDSKFIFITTNFNGKSAQMIIERGETNLDIINTMGGEYL
jgi:hypothetical protein